MLDFPRTYRLVNKHDFQSVFANPCKITRKYLIVLYKSNQLPHARLGLIIAKHRVKPAVDRNRVRRVMRESFRHHKEALKGLDIIILMRSECTPLSKEAGKKALRDDIDNLWPQLVNSSKPV